MKLLLALSLLATQANADLVGNQTMKGSFWAVYPNGGAAPECVVDPGTPVDISCCAAMTPAPLITDAAQGSTCFAFDPEAGIRAYKGCNATTSLYGEFCAQGDPANVDITECGCQFQVSGTGCHKANDFPDDPRQFFVYLDDSECEGEKEMDTGDMPEVEEPKEEDKASAATGFSTAAIGALVSASVVLLHL